MKRFLPVFAVALATVSPAAADGPAPLHWGEAETLYTTVCEKRWHAVRIHALRNLAVDSGEGALAQIEREKGAHFAGQARCFTGTVTHWPVPQADVIDGMKTWTQVEDPDGPVACFDGKRCRWEIRLGRFVESHISLDGGAPAPLAVYVATERAIAPSPNLGK